MTDPSLPDLVRRVDELVQQQREVLSRIDQLLRDVAQTYASKELVEANRRLHDQRLGELEKDNDNNAGFKRQVIASLIVMFLGTLFALIIALGPNVGAP